MRNHFNINPLNGIFYTLILVFALSGCNSNSKKKEWGPIAIHSENPHVFLWKGKAKVFVASGEHYGALINKEFDYVKYFKKLNETGLEHTRLFLGDYLEEPGSFWGVLKGVNTLSPDSGMFICPWARSTEPGYSRGGNKFDLDQWDPEYFKRLHSLFETAAENNVTIEAMLFFVGPSWNIMPLNPINNINHTEQVGKGYLGANGYMVVRDGSKIMKYQEAYVRKMVQELNKYDHFFWNVANEPWLFNGASLNNKTEPAWSGIEMKDSTKAFIQKVAKWIKDEESQLPKKHLMGVDITNEGHIVKQTDLETYYKDLDILNVHYDTAARSLDMNYFRTTKLFTFNETGLTKDKMDPIYRTAGWYYLMSGGGLYGNLDYTFYHSGHEEGSFDPVFPDWYIGCGNPKIKNELAILQKFMDSMPLENMFRDTLSCISPEARVISWPGHYYAAFFKGDGVVNAEMNLPPGKYRAWWTNILNGQIENTEEFKHKGGKITLQTYQRKGGGGALKIVITE